MARLWTLVPPLALAFLLTTAHEALAGPGGAIAKAAFKSPLGRVLGILLAIVLLPLLVYVFLGQWLGVRRTRRDMAKLAREQPAFAWEPLERQLREQVPQLYRAWDAGDLRPCAAFLTEHFFLSQQDLLGRWREEGKQNVCELKKLHSLSPLYVSTGGQATVPTVLVLLTVDLVDYLQNVTTGKILKGRKRTVRSHDVIWRLVLVPGGQWALHSIEEGSLSLAFAREPNEIADRRRLPAGVAPRPVGTSHLPALDPAADAPATEAEQPVVEVECQHHDD